MKRSAIAVMVLAVMVGAAVAGWMGARPDSTGVKEVTTLIVPGVRQGASDWAVSTAYAAGQYVDNGGNTYVCLTGGTSWTNAGPSHTYGANTNDNLVEWRYVRQGRRQHLALYNYGTGTVYLAIGDSNATRSAGVSIAAGGNYAFPDGDVPQGEIWGISPAAQTNTVGWSEN